MRHIWAFAAVVLCLGLWGGHALPSSGSELDVGSQWSDDEPTIGLALSGGGAKGFAHIGVLQVLEEVGLVPDIVTGTSMGAVIGGLYAAGYDADDLERIAGETDWETMFSDLAEHQDQTLQQRLTAHPRMLTLSLQEDRPRLPTGLIRGQRISAELARLTWGVQPIDDFRELPISFAALGADIETGDAVRLDRGSLPRALRASVGIPSVFTPVEIDGQLLVDGGIARNLPVEDAFDMGADIVISVNLAADLKTREQLATLFDMLEQTMLLYVGPPMRGQEQMADVNVRPRVFDLSMTDFDRHDEFIERGEAAAREAQKELTAIVEQLAAPRSPVPAQPDPEREFAMRSLEIKGADAALEPLIRERMQLPAGEETPRIDAEDLRQAVSRVYGTGFFENVEYRLRPANDFAGSPPAAAAEAPLVDVVVEVTESEGSDVGFGLRFDSEFGAGVLLEFGTRQQLRAGDTFRVTGRLGDNVIVDALYGLPIRFFRPLHVGVGARLEEISLPGVGSSPSQRSPIRTASLSALFTRQIGDAALTGPGIVGEVYQSGSELQTPDHVADQDALAMLYWPLWLETLDRQGFPTRGQHLRISGRWTAPMLGSSHRFGHYALHWEGFAPVHDRVTLQLRVGAGYATSHAPLQYRFYAGGSPLRPPADTQLHPLAGHDPFTFRGRTLQLAAVGLQVEPYPDIFTTLSWETARLDDTWEWVPDAREFASGWRLSAGRATRIGPVGVSVMAPHDLSTALLEVNLGYSF